MKLPKRLVSEKTTYITSDDGVIPIDHLPEEIQQEFEVLDMMKNRLTDFRFEIELMGHAIKSKTNEIGLMVQEHFNSSAEQISVPLQVAQKVVNENAG